MQGFIKCSGKACASPCTAGCSMDAVAAHQFYGGVFTDPLTLNASACNAACLRSAACVRARAKTAPPHLGRRAPLTSDL